MIMIIIVIVIVIMIIFPSQKLISMERPSALILLLSIIIIFKIIFITSDWKFNQKTVNSLIRSKKRENVAGREPTSEHKSTSTDNLFYIMRFRRKY